MGIWKMKIRSHDKNVDLITLPHTKDAVNAGTSSLFQ